MVEALHKLLDELELRGAIDDPLEVLTAFTDWAKSTDRVLYPHQQEAAEHLILEDRHLIAPTPTGSGKSLIGIAAILWALARDGVAFYTAPLKALVSEKFFELVDLFGASNVGMITGDGSVNPDAPIICSTAEILANQCLRWGDEVQVDTVVMDEFHYYTDTERGWAWQAPLITLTETRFVLLSATLGDTSFFESYLAKRTGRKVAVLNSVQRPVPLQMDYSTEPVEKLLLGLAQQDKLPAYLVHSSQKASVAEAERLSALDLDLGLCVDSATRLREEIAEVSFHSSFGKILRPLLLQGIAIHHAGMLPRYRRLVERLAGMGLLKVISGTDTLGVGINVPIRTVVMTSLVKFDGTKERHLSAREFHQIAGRAGRAGYDTVGYVEVQAPEWEIENATAISRAGDDPKRLAKIKKKQAPQEKTSWTQGTFARLVEAQPEPMIPKWKITHAMVLHTLQRPGNQAENLQALATENHNALRATGSAAEHNRFLVTLLEVLESLENSAVIRRIGSDPTSASTRWELTADLPENFALNQSLAPFALDYLHAFTPPINSTSPAKEAPEKEFFAPANNGFGQTLDVLSVVEAVLDNPQVLLNAQQQKARQTEYNALRSQGVDYCERQTRLEAISYPQPLKAELSVAFDTYCQANPWAKGYFLAPKSILRDMVEQGATFSSYVAQLGVPYSEGVLLRYLSDAYRTLSQIVPPALHTPRFEEVLAWLAELLAKVDSSLLDEWRFLENPSLLGQLEVAKGSPEAELAFGQRPDGTFDYLLNPTRLTAEMHKLLLTWLDDMGGDLFEKLAKREAELRATLTEANWLSAENSATSATPLLTLPIIGEPGWDKLLGRYWDAHDFMDCAGDARHPRNFQVLTKPTEADLPVGLAPTLLNSEIPLWIAELTIVDGEADLDFALYALIDPKLSTAQRHPIWLPLGLHEKYG